MHQTPVPEPDSMHRRALNLFSMIFSENRVPLFRIML